ncbi:MAG: helix-turn-helix transcriptional regulator [Coprothermobacterota bacterium]|nr:helix-turn-helix transcriptional regulator [Coprothermobacterota bacterium]
MSEKEKELLSNIELGERLKQLLSERRVSITELAEKVGISRPTLYRILEGKSDLKLKDAIAIARYLNVPLESLYGLEEEANPIDLSNLAVHYGLFKSEESKLIQKIYKSLARKELAKILREAADMLDITEP